MSYNGFVLVVRHPENGNEFTTTDGIKVIDIDLGSSFDGTPESEEQALGWVENLGRWLGDVPPDSAIFEATVLTVYEAVAGTTPPPSRRSTPT